MNSGFLFLTNETPANLSNLSSWLRQN